MSPERNIVVSHRFQFPAERVFDAWLDPILAPQFLFATETGEMIRSEIDPHIGGSFTIVERRGGEDVEHTGKYLKIERSTKYQGRLAFTLRVPKYSPVVALVTINILPRPDGCELFLTQESGRHTAEEKDRIAAGWKSVCEKQAKVLTLAS
jgi:uncharacterized protein YndB with AHSA1/START domain